MADLPYIDATMEVKIAGQDGTGNNVNYVSADTNGNMFTKDYSDGPVSPGTAASSSLLIGAQFNTTLPTLTNTQQSAVQVDSRGRLLIVDSNLPATVDTNYGTVGASTLRTASQIGNATGGADFAAGNSSAQTLRVVIATNQSALPVTGTFWQATQPVSGTVAATQSGTWNIGTLTSITNPVAVTGTFWQATQPVSGTVTANQGTSPWVVSGTVTTTPPANASTNITQWNSVALGSPSAYGTAPGAVNVPGVNAFITNSVAVTGTFWQTTQPVSGTVAVTQSTSPWVVSGTVTATNPSVGTVAATPPTSATYIGGSVTTAAPTYVTGQMDPLSLNTSGGLRIAGVTGIIDAASTQNVATPASAIAVLGEFNTTPTTITTGNSSPLQLDSAANLLVNLKTALPTGANTIGAVNQGTSPWVVSGTVTANQGTANATPWNENVAQFGGSAVVTGTGAAGAGIPRVTVSNDSNILATQSGTWTVQPGNTANTTAWFVKDNSLGTVAAGTAGTQSSLAGGVFNTALPTLTTGQQVALQLDSSGRLIIAPTTQGLLAEDHNWGTVGANTLRAAAEIGNATGAADFNFGTVGAQTLRVAAELGNATGIADFGAGTATAQTLRVTVSNLPTTLDTNYGTVGASTLRTASEIGNATGAANFGAGATGAQTLRVSANLSDGAGTALTSSLVNTQQALFVRQAAPGLDLSGTGTIAALNGTVSANTQGCSMVTFWISGTFVLTYLFEGTADGTNWEGVVAYNVGFGYIQGSNNAANAMYSIACGGFQQVRMRAVLYTSGTATINWNASQGTNSDHNINADTNPISQNITTQDLATTNTTGANGQVIYGGTPTAGSFISYPIQTVQSVAIEFTGVWTGTLQVEVSMDSGGSWVARPVYQIGTGKVQASFTQNFAGIINVAGYTNFRVRAIAAMTGTATPVIVQSTTSAGALYVAGPVQELKDTGRNQTNYYMATQVVSTATDTLMSLTGYKGNAAVAATTTPAVVTAGKVYRITSVTITYIAITTAGTVHFTLRANTGGVVAIGSPAVQEWVVGGPAATAGVSQTVSIAIPDGIEFYAGTGIGVSMQGFGATGTAAAVGYGAISFHGFEF